MIKAYLYPQFEIVDNCYVMDNPARVEVELPALPVKGMEVLCVNQKEIGISQKFFESCEEQLLNPNSVINEFICKLRENILNKEERIKNYPNGFSNSMSIPIICTTFVEKNINYRKIFKTISEVVSYFKENNIVKYISEAKISNNCKGKINFASKLLNDGTPLVFKFLFDIDKEYLLKIKEEEIDNEQIELIDIWLEKIEDPEF